MGVALARHSSFHETEIIQSSVSVITSGGSRGARPAPPPPPPPPPPPTIIFAQTEDPRAEFFFFLEAGPLPPPLSQGQEDRASPLSEGLCGFTEHFTTYAYCYSFLHFLFITVLSSCSSRCVPACVCCLYWWDCKKLPSPTKQLQTLAPTAGAFSQRGNTYIVCSSKNVWNRPPELPCRLLSLFRPIVNAMNFNDSDSGECHTNFIGGER